MSVWCEHCRDHYDVSHYDEHGHRVGKEHGPTGAAMAAERIVEALAKTHPCHGCPLPACGLCDAPSPRGALDHDPGCPWRLAVQWVAERRPKGPENP